MTCPSLETVTITEKNTNTSNVTSTYRMFEGCPKITCINASAMDFRNVTDMTGWNRPFSSSSNLTDFISFKNVSCNWDVSCWPALTEESLMSIINNLATVSTTKTLTLGTKNIAKLTIEQISIATNKGWTIK